MKLSDLKPNQRRTLLTSFFSVIVASALFLSYAVSQNIVSKGVQKAFWYENLSAADSLHLAERHHPTATKVHVGMHVEAIKEINLKSSYYQILTEIWFRWSGDPKLDMKSNFRIFGGKIVEKYLIKEVITETDCYQLLRCDVQVTQNFWTTRFPLESHQLRMYVESDLPLDRVVFLDDGVSDIDRSAFINGFDIVKQTNGLAPKTCSSHKGDPTLDNGSNMELAQYFNFLRINRSSWGLYIKCFIALFGTTIWVLIVLYLSAFHKVDPIGMIPAALFGTVANLMVGANLLPDALTLGLMEYVNIFGVATILAITLTIIKINSLRNKHNDAPFAHFYGLVMFYTILTIVLLGHIIMPCTAYFFNPIA